MARRKAGSHLVTIDPGKFKVGVAIFDGNARLTYACTVTIPTHTPDPLICRLMAVAIDDVALDVLGDAAADVYWISETPQSYAGKGGREPDLKPMRELIAELRRTRTVGTVAPRTWKGNVPKPIHHERILAALSPQETRRIEDFGHDALDAIGIGLFKLKRQGRGGARVTDG